MKENNALETDPWLFKKGKVLSDGDKEYHMAARDNVFMFECRKFVINNLAIHSRRQDESFSE